MGWRADKPLFDITYDVGWCIDNPHESTDDFGWSIISLYDFTDDVGWRIDKSLLMNLDDASKNPYGFADDIGWRIDKPLKDFFLMILLLMLDDAS